MTQIEHATYNGWRNHATWAIGLHLIDTVVCWICEDRDSWGTDNDLEAATDLFRELVEEQIEASGIATFSLLWELLDLSDIDWYALGRHALEAAEIPQTVTR
jgi:hypothetical protein